MQFQFSFIKFKGCHFNYFFIISIVFCIPATCTKVQKEVTSDNGLREFSSEKISKDLIDKTISSQGCSCGQFGICKRNEFGETACACDYGYADLNGTCRSCDCNLMSKRFVGIDCKFENGLKQCICPPGFETVSTYCRDINECYTFINCPANSICINKPGTFECRCKEGFKPIYSSFISKLLECIDIDECLDFPCKSPLTSCTNSPGSYNCVCLDGYYSTSGSYGSTYQPASNNCYEIETQWREATIALGVIFSVTIIGMIYYIKKHKPS